ncbi:GEVED domain-containing protein [Hymenobacter sp. 15J16-1T3B]|nr:GEVED domain-containing protein [Hymenobacter sp. 15J16-1T3B]
MWIDYDHSATFEASEFIPLGSSDAIATIVTFTKDLTVPLTAELGPTRVRVRWRNDPFGGTDACFAHVNSTTNWYGETEDYLVTIADAPTCTAPPATVAATASVSSACANGSFSLATSSIPTSLGGYTYQWQSSPAGAGAFADISGATTNPYTVTGQTAATDYQLIVSCQYGGTPVTSNVVAVGQNSFDQCYCAPASTNGCATYGAIANVKLGTLDNSSGCAGSTYTAFAPTGAATTSLNLGSTVPLTLTLANANSYRYAVWIDFNHNGSFDATEFVASGTPSTSLTTTASIVLPVESATVLSGATRLRIRTNAGNAAYGNFAAGDACSVTYDGETEDYTITLLGQTPCSGGAPTATAAASVASACVNSPFTLTAAVPGNVTGLSYQWESSPAGAGTFAPIGGATAATYAVPRQEAATDYRVQVTCAASAQTQPSNTVAVGQVDFLTCYPTPVVGDGTNEFIRSVSVNGSSGFTNTTDANASGGYADFTANQAMTTTLSRGSSYPLRVIVKSNNGGSQGALWIDYDHSATFDAGEYFRFGRSNLNGSAGASVTLDTTLTIPNNATVHLGPTRLRVRWRNGAIAATDGQTAGATAWYGETEDYLITLADASPLPVELLRFTATPGPAAVRLAWATATERNSSRFEVERRLDEAGFQRIATVEAAGTSTSVRSYALTDTNLPAAGKRAYYRLRQVDQDGTASYSEVRAVALGTAGLTLYPNPTAAAAKLTGAEPGAVVQVLDVLNKVVLTVRADAAGTAQLQLPATQARGVYLVRTGPHTARLLLER